MSTISKILIAVDSSACALNAAKKGFALAHQLNATVGLIFVVDRSKEAISADLDITASESETVLLKQAEETLTQLAKLYDGQGEVFRFTPEGNPKEEIISLSEQWKADMIVIGAHGRSAFMEFLVGSVTESIIRHSTKPVLVVRQKKGQ